MRIVATRHGFEETLLRMQMMIIRMMMVILTKMMMIMIMRMMMKKMMMPMSLFALLLTFSQVSVCAEVPVQSRFWQHYSLKK